MATYSIRTTRQQEVGLKFAYDTYADKEVYPTQESYFQFRIDKQVSDLLYQDQQRAMSKSFDDSFTTIPELERPAAKAEIEATITAHGGTIVAPGSPIVNPTLLFPVPVVRLPALPPPLPPAPKETP